VCVCVWPILAEFFDKAAVLKVLEELLALARVGRRRRASGGSRECERRAVSLALSCAP
jgi:hypothetical protein